MGIVTRGGKKERGTPTLRFAEGGFGRIKGFRGWTSASNVAKRRGGEENAEVFYRVDPAEELDIKGDEKASDVRKIRLSLAVEGRDKKGI